MSRRAMRRMSSTTLRMREEAEGNHQAGRWQRTQHSAHGLHRLLASRRYAHVRAAVYGKSIREVAGIFQRRSRASQVMERTRYATTPIKRPRRERLRTRPARRDATNHRRRKK